MTAVKRTIIPTNEADLPAWLGQHPEHVAEYVAVEGPHWVKIAGKWVFQFFGERDDRLANEIGWGALTALSQLARSGRLTEVRRMRPWLNGVLKKMTQRALRNHVRQRPTLEVDPERFLQIPEEPFDAQETAATIQKIEDCLQRLAAGEQQVIRCLMVDPDDPPEPKDIAAALGISAGSVRVQLSTGRAKLADCLTKKGVAL